MGPGGDPKSPNASFVYNGESALRASILSLAPSPLDVVIHRAPNQIARAPTRPRSQIGRVAESLGSRPRARPPPIALQFGPNLAHLTQWDEMRWRIHLAAARPPNEYMSEKSAFLIRRASCHREGAEVT